MRITKRQLKRIIQEEKSKLLKEGGWAAAPNLKSTMDISHMHADIIGEIPDKVADAFEMHMMDYFEDHPQDFEGTEAEWKEQVYAAVSLLHVNVSKAVENEVKKVESMLFDGQMKNQTRFEI